VKISCNALETHVLEILEPLETDSGLYACVVENVAGKVTVVGRLTVEFGTVMRFFCKRLFVGVCFNNRMCRFLLLK